MLFRSYADQLGKSGELHVARFLEHRHCRIIERNWRIKNGEIDIVARSATNEIVFIEVKTRSTPAFGDPLESISAEKLHRLQRLALAWLATHQLLGSPYRIDVAGIMLGRSGELSIDYRIGIS